MLYKLFLVTGIVLLFFSLYKWKQSVDFVRAGEKAIGTVSVLEEIDGSYSPVFVIETHQRETVFYNHPVSTSPASWEIGEQAVFLYDPLHPQSVKMMSYFWLFNWAIVFMVLAISFMIVGGGYFWLNPLIRATDES